MDAETDIKADCMRGDGMPSCSQPYSLVICFLYSEGVIFL